MFTIYKHELKLYVRSLLIWILCVGGMGFACILLFSGMQNSMNDMAESFASMGAFSDAFGMNQLSIATLTGFYAAEVGTIHALGGSMFAAIIATGILSKEEEGHTSEFLFSLPVSRAKIITSKWYAVITEILIFNLFCVGIYAVGFSILGEEMFVKKFLLYHLMQIVMQVEIAGICFGISACMKKNKSGIGLGVVLLLYAYDMIARVVPDLEEYKILSPFSYANAADILSEGKIVLSALVIGAFVLGISMFISFAVYGKRDLAA